MEADPTYNQDQLNWLSLLEQVIAIGQDSQGRGYIYIKKDQVALFESKKEAKNDRYKPLTLKKINKSTQKILSNCNDPSIERKAAILLNKIVKLNVYKQETKKLSSIRGFLPLSEKRVAAKLERYASNLEIEAFSKILNETTGVIVSNDGVLGVIFLETKGDRRLVLKPVEDPFAELFAERFLDAMGFKTPLSQIVAKNSKEGQLIVKVLKENNLKGPRSETSTRERKMAQAVKSYPYFLAMNVLEATSFKQILRDQIKEIISDPAMLQKIGEIVFYDQFLNNGDRIWINTSNTGNFMLMQDNQTLALIDSTVRTPMEEEEDQSNLEQIEDLLCNDAHANRMLQFFINGMLMKAGIKVDNVGQKQLMQEHLKKGISIGAQKLTERFPVSDSLLDLARFGENIPSNVNLEILTSRLDFVHRLLKEIQSESESTSESL